MTDGLINKRWYLREQTAYCPQWQDLSRHSIQVIVEKLEEKYNAPLSTYVRKFKVAMRYVFASMNILLTECRPYLAYMYSYQEFDTMQ